MNSVQLFLGFSKKIFVQTLAFVVLTTCALSTARATTLSYNFSLGGNGFSTSFLNPDTSKTRFFHGAGSFTVTYDTVSEQLGLVATANGNIYGAVAGNFPDFGNVLVNNVIATANITLQHIEPGINSGGLVGLTGNGAMGMGTFTFSDIGLGNGLTSVSVMPMLMTGPDFASLPAGNTDFADLLALPDGIYWQYLVTSPLSSFFNQTVSFSWYNSLHPLSVSGTDFDVHADILGTEVPEPVTAVLLGAGLLGGLASRRKKQS